MTALLLLANVSPVSDLNKMSTICPDDDDDDVDDVDDAEVDDEEDEVAEDDDDDDPEEDDEEDSVVVPSSRQPAITVAPKVIPRIYATLERVMRPLFQEYGSTTLDPKRGIF